MSDRLSIELVVGTLWVTTFTCAGLLGLWTATSRWNWFLRTAIALAALSPLLLIPAYEPFLLLLIQLAVVTLGIATHRWYRRKASANGAGPQDASVPHSRRSFRFSLTTIMLATALVAVAVWIAVRIPQEVWLGGSDYLLTGATLGAVVLLSAWLVYARFRGTVRLGLSIVVAMALSIPPSYFDDWPKDVVHTVAMCLTPLSWPGMSDWATIWFAIVPSVLFLSAINLLLVRSAGIASVLGCGLPGPSSSTRAVRYVRAASSAVLLAATSIPPATTCWELLHPLPIPIVALPDPNGYDDLVAAGKMFDSPILSTALRPRSTAELAAEVAKYSEAYDRAGQGLAREVVSPVWSGDQVLGQDYLLCVDDIQSFRSVARALSMESELARCECRPAEAATIAVDAIGLGHAVVRQGVVCVLLVGIAIEDIGQADLYRVIDDLSPESCRELIQKLGLLEKRREPLAEILHRDRIVCENAWGWHGHLYEFLADVVGGESRTADTVRDVRAKTVATSHLLTIALALRAYVVDRGAYPDDLRQLVPEYLPSLPPDPFQPAGNGFVYRLADGGYVLYSFGPNRRDDGGAPYEQTWDGSRFWNEGDLRLDVLFKSEKEPAEDADDGDDTKQCTSNNSVYR